MQHSPLCDSDSSLTLDQRPVTSPRCLSESLWLSLTQSDSVWPSVQVSQFSFSGCNAKQRQRQRLMCRLAKSTSWSTSCMVNMLTSWHGGWSRRWCDELSSIKLKWRRFDDVSSEFKHKTVGGVKFNILAFQISRKTYQFMENLKKIRGKFYKIQKSWKWPCYGEGENADWHWLVSETKSTVSGIYSVAM
jgi:hypothetical protein